MQNQNLLFIPENGDGGLTMEMNVSGESGFYQVAVQDIDFVEDIQIDYDSIKVYRTESTADEMTNPWIYNIQEANHLGTGDKGFSFQVSASTLSTSRVAYIYVRGMQLGGGEWRDGYLKVTQNPKQEGEQPVYLLQFNESGTEVSSADTSVRAEFSYSGYEFSDITFDRGSYTWMQVVGSGTTKSGGYITINVSRNTDETANREGWIFARANKNGYNLSSSFNVKQNRAATFEPTDPPIDVTPADTIHFYYPAGETELTGSTPTVVLDENYQDFTVGVDCLGASRWGTSIVTNPSNMLSVIEGINKNEMTLHVSHNSGTSVRTATIRVYCYDANGTPIERVLTIKQNAAAQQPESTCSIAANPDSFHDTGQGRTLGSQITAIGIQNSTIQATTENTDWIGPYYDVTNGVVRIYLNPNTTSGSRTGYVTVSGTGTDGRTYSTTIIIEQDKLQETPVETTKSLAFDEPKAKILEASFSGATTAAFTYSGITYESITVSDDAEWLTVEKNGSGVTYTVVSANTSKEPRSATITIQSGALSDTYTVTQKAMALGKITVNGTEYADGSSISQPIWKPFVVGLSYTIDDSVMLTVSDGNGVCIEAEVYPMPNGWLEIDLRSILAQFLETMLDVKDISGWRQDSEAGKDFTIEIDGLTLHAFTWNDWSYDEVGVTERLVLSNPINGLLDIRQMAVWSVVNTQDAPARLTILGTEAPRGKGVHHYFKRLTSTGIGKRYDGKSFTYRLTDKCFPYCVYYRNSEGGFDSILLNEKSRKDSLQSSTITRVHGTSVLYGVRKDRYENIITEQWQLATPYLTDEEAGRMHELIESTECYLQSLDEGWIKPVTITETQAEYKKRILNSRKPIFYTINFEASEKRIRR